MRKRTYLINLAGGPCVGKSVLAALIFVKLKLLNGYSVEYVQEFAKSLVWKKDFDTLNNQYYVTSQQYKLFLQMNGVVDYLVTDGSILHGLYYNRHNLDNTSNIDKTEKFILSCNDKFNNINIFLKRGKHAYEQHGRIQTEEEAKEIDVILKHLLDQHKIPYKTFESDVKNVDQMIKYIEEFVKNDKEKTSENGEEVEEEEDIEITSL